MLTTSDIWVIDWLVKLNVSILSSHLHDYSPMNVDYTRGEGNCGTGLVAIKTSCAMLGLRIHPWGLLSLLAVCQVWEIYGGNSRNSGHQVQTSPFRPLSQDFGLEYQRSEYWNMDQSWSRSRTWRTSYQGEDLFDIWTKVSTWHVWGIYTKYWNKQRDKSENNKTNKIHKEYKVSTENKEFIVLRVVTSRVQELKNTRLYMNYLF